MARNRQIQYLAFFIVISLACWLMASNSSAKFLTTPLFALAPLLLWRKGVEQVYRQQISVKSAVPILFFTTVFVVLVIVSAMAGWTKASNDWFSSFEYRPIVAAITWMVFVCVGGLALRKERSLNTTVNSDAEKSSRRLL